MALCTFTYFFGGHIDPLDASEPNVSTTILISSAFYAYYRVAREHNLSVESV